MSDPIHRTFTVENSAIPGSRAALMRSEGNGVQVNTRLEVQPGPGGFFIISIDQAERLTRHKRGITRSVSFVISGEGLEHIFGSEVKNGG